MPAHAEELRQAEEEGIVFRWLSTIAAIDPARLTIERMRLDEHGMPQPTGELEELDADCVVLALGQEADLSLLRGLDGVSVEAGLVQVDPNLMSGHPGVFAGGDVIAGERMAAVAIGEGRRAADRLDAWLRGAQPSPAPRGQIADFGSLNTWYYEDAPQALRPTLERARRLNTFEEVVGGLDAQSALQEARRCLSCGNCFECDNCYGVCPDDAVLKPGPLGEAYAFDLDYCKGCGICVQECPCGAIELIPEET
jgi:NADPH-dependent glutamate synthase beta subunit-like oxidoreductase